MLKDTWLRIRSRTKQEWAAQARERSVDTRIWIQEHAERSALIGFLAGIFLVLFFEFTIWLIFITCVIAAVLYLSAPPGVAVRPNQTNGVSHENDRNGI